MILLTVEEKIRVWLILDKQMENFNFHASDYGTRRSGCNMQTLGCQKAMEKKSKNVH